MSNSKALKFGVAIDGSQLSEQAMKAGCGMFNLARKDTLTILHVDPNNSTARHLQPTHLKHQYQGLAMDMRVGRGAAWGSGCAAHARMHAHACSCCCAVHASSPLPPSRCVAVRIHIHQPRSTLAALTHAQVPAEWAGCEKEPGQTTCQALTALAASQGIDLLLVGSYGRKGEKIDMLGSVSDYSLRESHSSVMIVR